VEKDPHKKVFVVRRAPSPLKSISFLRWCEGRIYAH